HGVAAAEEVVGELAGDLLRTLPLRRFETSSDPPVEQGSRAGREAVVEHLSVQLVLEPVFGGDGAVRPATQLAGHDELVPLCEGVAAPLRFLHAQAGRREEGGRESGSGDAGGTEQLLI